MPFSRERLSVDLAVGLGLVFYNMRWLNSTIYCTINIDSADIYGVAQLNTYERGFDFAGFFRTRVNYLVYKNIYTGGALLLDYDFHMGGVPLKCVLNFGVKF